ncbi:MAG TPA: clostripain-related cysteine peptidase, partial [Blastocatellia bacterium]|nr:clostripain-related cysteine peptidase [Blastocatellia bacterium]
MNKKKPQNKTAQKNQKEWTIMVYMAGDNNLAVDMAYNLEQIREVAKKGADKLNLFVYYDGHSSQIPTLYCDFSNPDNPIYVPSCSVPDKLFPDVPKEWNENAASKYSLINFVDWCVNKQVGRAERYAMIFSGHSLGFADKGLFKDETSGEAMKIKDLFFALQRIGMQEENLACERDQEDVTELMVDKTDVLLGQRLDILGFDSCLMGMFEVGYQFKDIAETMIVSEGSVPSAGWSYAKILADLASGTSNRDIKEVAEHFVIKFIQSQDNYIVGGISVDMAAWDMSKFENLALAVNDLSETLTELFFFEKPTSCIYKQMERIILQAHWKCQSYMFDQNVDLGDFCELLIQECDSVVREFAGRDDSLTFKDVKKKCQRVLKALKNVVILSGFSGGEYQFSNGVSLFFPWSLEGFQASLENYEGTWYGMDSECKGELGWNRFLELYLGKVARREAALPTDTKNKMAKRLQQAKPGLKKTVVSDSRYVYSSGIIFSQEPNWELSQVVEASETKGGGGTTSVSSKGGGGTTSGSSKGGGGTTSGSSKGGGGTT